MMSVMSDKLIILSKEYSTSETAKLVNLTAKQITRLVDDGHFPGAYRKSPVHGSHRVIPGRAIVAFQEARKIKTDPTANE